MKMKRMCFRLIVTLGLLALLLVPASPVAAANGVSIGVLPATQVPPSGNFTARVNLDSVTNFDAAQYDVAYNSAVIQVTSVTAGLIGATAIPVDSWGYIPTGVQGKIRVINNVPGVPGVTGSGYLAEIHFHVVGAAGTNSNISLSAGILGDKNAVQIPATWADGAVNVTTAVTADFSANATEILINQNLTFTANPAGGSGGYTYSWNFGDTGTSTSANPAHFYTSPGSYTVALTVTDSSLNSANATKTGYITVYAALVAGASTDISEAKVGQSINFNSGTTTGGKPGYLHAWDFKDTGTSTNTNPTHSFAASGNYTVSLVVTDTLGNTSTTTVLVHVYKLGDADKNGTVDVVDITYIEHIIIGDFPLGYVSGTWTDANLDGHTDVLDVTAVESIIHHP